ncbi:MAG: biopolymer transporter ExbD, partial [Lentisphaerae bacterium]|nr:biopolymer transporter ExbD [Lentisphaerota bacterium]
EESSGVRIAPLIDVVFLLLVFFLVATTFYEAEKDITIKLAPATEGMEREKLPDLIIVNVSEAGAIVVNQRMLTIGELDELFAAARQQHQSVAVVIRCDKRSRHNDFVAVLNACEKASISQVSVATFQTGEI